MGSNPILPFLVVPVAVAIIIPNVTVKMAWVLLDYFLVYGYLTKIVCSEQKMPKGSVKRKSLCKDST